MVGDTYEVHIQTIKEQMRYDRTAFAVKPGMKVRLIFTNPDAMDHNFILAQPGSAAKIAFAAMKLENTGEGVAKQWRPDVEEIILASKLLAHDESQTLEFTAPLLSGNYDYLCTFPGHWQLMRGVMIVTDEPEKAMLAHRETSEDAPLVSNREVVENWEYDSLKGELYANMMNRSYESGKEMFRIASCTQCHAMQGEGATIGPDLADISKTYKPLEVLQHIMDPSLKVDDEYKTYVIETKDDDEFYGTIIEQDEKELRIVENPLQPETAVTVQKKDITVMDAIDLSPMPTELLITLEKKEIWDLVAFIVSGDDAEHEVFKN